MEAAWQHEVQGLYDELRALAACPVANVPEWSKALVDGWQPPVVFSPATRFGTLMLEVPADARPKHERLALPGPAMLTQPLMLAYPQQGSILIETKNVSDGESSAAIDNVLLRLLCATPPGKVSFTIIDTCSGSARTSPGSCTSVTTRSADQSPHLDAARSDRGDARPN